MLAVLRILVDVGTAATAISRVLLVDDEASILLALRRLLGRRNIEIVAAPAALQALTLLRREPFQAIIADYSMPTHDGLWLMRQVERTQPEVMRILISGFRVPDIDLELARGTVHHFARKPIELAELLAFLGIRPAAGEER